MYINKLGSFGDCIFGTIAAAKFLAKHHSSALSVLVSGEGH